jgi:hypothetical protein
VLGFMKKNIIMIIIIVFIFVAFSMRAKGTSAGPTTYTRMRDEMGTFVGVLASYRPHDIANNFKDEPLLVGKFYNIPETYNAYVRGFMGSRHNLIVSIDLVGGGVYVGFFDDARLLDRKKGEDLQKKFAKTGEYFSNCAGDPYISGGTILKYAFNIPSIDLVNRRILSSRDIIVLDLTSSNDDIVIFQTGK